MTKRKTNKVGKPLSIVLLILSGLLLGLLYYYNMFPLKYILSISVVFCLFIFILFCLLRKKILKKRVLLLSLIILIVEIMINYYLLITLGFLNRITAYDYKTHVYNIMVLKKSNYKKINDLKDKRIGIYKEDNIKYLKYSIANL